MKKRVGILMLGLPLLLLSACLSTTQISQEDTDLVAEYLAGRILRYDKEYAECLIDYDTLYPEASATQIPTATVTPTVTPTATPAPTTEAGAPTVPPGQESDINNLTANADLTEVIGIPGITAEYRDYGIYESYSDGNAYFNVQAMEGEHLYIVEFALTNTTEEPILVNLGPLDIKYRADINTSVIYLPDLTSLINDMQYYSEEIAAGGTKTGVLVFRISDAYQGAESIHLVITVGDADKTAIIKIK